MLTSPLFPFLSFKSHCIAAPSDPSSRPSRSPSAGPSGQPSTNPAGPSSRPSGAPTARPTVRPSLCSEWFPFHSISFHRFHLCRVVPAALLPVAPLRIHRVLLHRPLGSPAGGRTPAPAGSPRPVPVDGRPGNPREGLRRSRSPLRPANLGGAPPLRPLRNRYGETSCLSPCSGRLIESSSSSYSDLHTYIPIGPAISQWSAVLAAALRSVLPPWEQPLRCTLCATGMEKHLVLLLVLAAFR